MNALLFGSLLRNSASSSSTLNATTAAFGDFRAMSGSSNQEVIAIQFRELPGSSQAMPANPLIRHDRLTASLGRARAPETPATLRAGARPRLAVKRSWPYLATLTS